MSIVDKIYLNVQQADEDVAFNAMHDLAKELEAHCEAMARSMTNHFKIAPCSMCEKKVSEYEKFRQERTR